MSETSDAIQSAFLTKYPGADKLRIGLSQVIERLPDALVTYGVPPTERPSFPEGALWWRVGAVSALNSLDPASVVRQELFIEGRPHPDGQGLYGLLAIEIPDTDDDGRPHPTAVRVARLHPGVPRDERFESLEVPGSLGRVAAWSNAHPEHRHNTHLVINELAHWAADHPEAAAFAVMTAIHHTPVSD